MAKYFINKFDIFVSIKKTFDLIKRFFIIHLIKTDDDDDELILIKFNLFQLCSNVMML